MELTQAIELIKNKDILAAGQNTRWADLGCGNGLFTAALAHLLQPGSMIYAVDKNAKALRQLPQRINEINIEKIHADFLEGSLNLRHLDGIIMANSLHFVKDKVPFIHKAQKWLKADGLMLIVEYNTDTAHPWVPYPLSLWSLSSLFEKMGYGIEKLHQRPSLFNRAPIYSVLIYRANNG